MILWLAGLNGIPAYLYEAAGVDGANIWHKFWYITIPELFPIAFVVTELSILNTFKVFREAYLIAGAYPKSEDIYMLQHLFNNWFVSLDIQKICAGAVMIASVILFIILLLQLIDSKAGNEE
jgi:multiple sugar transport system permease protein